MITPPDDILYQINVALVNITTNPVPDMDKIKHTLVHAKEEIGNLRHHIESMSTVRPTSTEMSILQDKSAEMVKIWNTANYHAEYKKDSVRKAGWGAGKDE